jgi:hypothetical protein
VGSGAPSPTLSGTTGPSSGSTSLALGGSAPITGVAAVIQVAQTQTPGAPAAKGANGNAASASGIPSVKGVAAEPMTLANGGWKGVSLRAATNLKVPILFGVVVALFVLVQALIDRRDPKMSRAPERNDDDTVGFR